MIDTHAHIDSSQFDDDRLQVIEDSFKSGVEYIIIPAIEPSTFKNVFETANLSEKIFCGIGIHPHNALDASQDNLELVEKLSYEPKVKAIGEIGLDYYYDFAPKDIQKDVFQKQLQIAKRRDLPSIVHNRESDNDLLSIIKEEQDGNLNAVLHCFSGDLDMLKLSLDLNLYISFTGNISFKKSTLNEIVSYVPLDRIMIETDSPFMSPVPHRGKRNNPALVKLVADKIAEIKSISINEVLSMTTKTAKQFFKIALIIIFLANLNLVQAQDDDISSQETSKPLYNPFFKKLGIGFVGGTNTIIESYMPKPQDISYEGVSALGGELQVGVFDYLHFGFSYITSQNKKRANNNKAIDTNSVLPNDFYSFYELTSYWTPNPSGKINFYGMLGMSYLISDIGQFDGTSKSEPNWNLNTGLGFSINIPVKSVGLFNFQAEWKLNYRFGVTNLDYDPRLNPKDPNFKSPVEQSVFFSIPRAKIVYFPNLW